MLQFTDAETLKPVFIRKDKIVLIKPGTVWANNAQETTACTWIILDTRDGDGVSVVEPPETVAAALA
jgi:hypothetical protein